MTHESYRWRSKWRGDGLTRRTFAAACAAIPTWAADREPEISSFDLSLIEDSPVPNELFFVREHFPEPRIGAAAWRLAVEGAVDNPFEIAREEWIGLPRTRLAATLECAENPPGGGLISHAVWEGVPAASLLDRARCKAQAKFVRFEGYDGFSRTLPAGSVRDNSVLIASRMNGELLPAHHGGPARLLAAGRYGMDSVKWLRKVELLESAPPSSDEYLRRSRSLLTGVVVGEPVGPVLVKSAFSRPADGAVLRSRRFLVRGVAWAHHPVVKVEVSSDAGVTWSPARLAKADRFCWAHWEWDWKIPAPGKHSLLVRATDSQGNSQPLERESRRADPYEQNSCHRVEVTAR